MALSKLMTNIRMVSMMFFLKNDNRNLPSVFHANDTRGCNATGHSLVTLEGKEGIPSSH